MANNNCFPLTPLIDSISTIRPQLFAFDNSNSCIKRLCTNRSFSRLRVKKLTCSHTWTIENFSLCPKKTGDLLTSPEFSDAPDSNLKWYLLLYPKGKTKKEAGSISVYLYLAASVKKPVLAKFEISLLNSKEKLIQKSSDEALFELEAPAISWGWSKFVDRSVLLSAERGLLPDDELTVHCEISASTEFNYITNPERPFGIARKEFRLSEQMASLLESENLSDVTLQVQGKKFRAHKAILAANSPVFSAMFEHNMKEKCGDIVDIQDCDGEAIGTLLRYMYTAETPVLDLEKAKHVMVASDKYAIESLKLICEEFLCLELSKESAADLVYLAEKHNAEILRDCALNCMSDHMTKVLDTSYWNLLDDPGKQAVEEAFKMIVSQEKL